MCKKINLILVINTPVRTDRLLHMTHELSKWDKTFERINAETVTAAMNFHNKYIRSNWISHEECISRAHANTTGLTLILEDDVRILDFPKIEKNVADVQELSWNVLYLFGSGKRDVLNKISHVIDAHAYIVNPENADLVLSAMRKYRSDIENNGIHEPRLSHIDHFFAHTLQLCMNFYGTEILVYQDRKVFGSDTGWGWNG